MSVSPTDRQIFPVGSEGGSQSFVVPSSSLGRFNRVVSENIKNSLAPRTWRDYSNAWFDWSNFCLGFQASKFNNQVDLLLCYLANLISNNCSTSHITKQLAGISFFQKMYGVVPANNHFLVKQAIKGHKRRKLSRDVRSPITFEVLNRLVSSLPLICNSSYESRLFRTVFIAAFFAALRINEVVAPNNKSKSPLKFSDVIVSEDSLRIFIRRSKTDQMGKGSWLSLYPLNSHICPIFNFREYLSLRPNLSDDFFVHLDGAPVTRFQFNYILKRAVSVVGLDSFKLTSHSFRIGAATEAARLGLSDSIIKRLGRWESNRFQLYIRPELIVI